MTIVHPRIGMDRYVDAEWMQLAAAVVRGEMEIEGLLARLETDIPSIQVRKKTIGILKRMWWSTNPAMAELASKAAEIADRENATRAGSYEAVAIAAYPYFRQVIENVGRLLRLQGSCTAGEVHRRMFDQHGKRTTIDQATSYAFKTMVSWGLVTRQADKRLAPALPLALHGDLKHLLDTAANVSRGSVSPLSASDPLLFAFQLV